MSFHVLGPLEVRVGDEALVVGGAKQRAVLAVLLLRAGEVVPVERLVDEVWGNDPPPSAAHTLESYISRVRQLLVGHGPLLVRKGAGYALELGDATLDSRGFCELQERAALAAAMDDHADVVALTTAALEMWRGPALADVALASAGRAEAERLEEIRLRTFELRFDSELALGQHERAVGELQPLVAQNPYRERFVAQLMLALYRAGRHRARICSSSPARSCARILSFDVRAHRSRTLVVIARSGAARGAWPSLSSWARSLPRPPP
jgi:DNA-binding SARP family transcriptional activator